ncbi:hypothetical protein HPB49_002561 [Dermacentor silvarum]|uniref:Uncharacterized protein n=1 Tax=Dermacentor silvarum TaxID=543639 RepID=A0ACB8C1S1_DERSI|nr:hypothetical protein HPB49_002561 [Dermacentor silvarum]
MSENEYLRQVRGYFTDQEWAEMPDLTRERYANIKRNYDVMVALDLKPAMPEFMKPKPVAPKPGAKKRAQSRSETQQPKKPANTAQAPKTGAKGKENSGAVKLAPRKKTWTAPVKDRAVLTDNRQLAAGAATDHKSANASDAGSKRPSRAQKKINYAECDDSDGESTNKPISSTGSDSSGDIRYPRRQRKEVNYMECEEGPDEDYLSHVITPDHKNALNMAVYKLNTTYQRRHGRIQPRARPESHLPPRRDVAGVVARDAQAWKF